MRFILFFKLTLDSTKEKKVYSSMALRVLLADESTSIKKVLQLALQDFAVEVKAVPIGVDVLPLAKSWRPDLIFADVLLQKRNGYEVCTDLKSDAETSSIPVVLMWSSFMQIDAAKVALCRSDRQLEKPFDAETLRKMVRELVPATQSNAISQFLNFPHLPDFVEKEAAPPPVFTSNPVDDEPTLVSHEVDEPEEFEQVPLPKMPPPTPDKEQWSAGSLDRFKINIPSEDLVEIGDDMQNLDSAPIAVSGAGEIQLGDLDGGSSLRTQSSTFGKSAANTREAVNLIDPAHAEQILREQVRVVLQDIAWKIIPDLAERVVREELQKLLKDAEKLK
jgi:two-component system, cell cycle response regulator